MEKPRIATVFLAGCFGCHMSLCDIDERLIDLAQLVDLSKSPLTDIKDFGKRCRIGLIEGGCANEDNVRLLQELRRNCDILVSVGECAIQGDIPSMRNTVPLAECLDVAYRSGPSVHNPGKVLPNDKELSLLLDRVYPCHEVVEIDCFIPGCPARADAIWEALTALLDGRAPALPYRLLKYD
jgi:NAD-reducing hydrogenase small subunit